NGPTPVTDLGRLPVARIKLDSRLIAQIGGPEGAPAARAVDAFLALALSLGVHVVAKGVETEHQLAYLRARGCDAAQGYHVARPMSAEDVSTMLREA
ncbi:MAG TPA: EAL domain-containing protein, partial [Longimicrobiales bacterium]|nr:EAL domain-containing protein [Longimicrobiales bacterium]